MKRAALASKVIDVLNLVNEQRAKVLALRAAVREVDELGRKAAALVEKLDASTRTPTMVDEALYECEAQPLDADQIAELLFTRERLVLFDIPKLTLKVLKLVEDSQ